LGARRFRSRPGENITLAALQMKANNLIQSWNVTWKAFVAIQGNFEPAAFCLIVHRIVCCILNKSASLSKSDER
jgi:hypothetical protein